MLRKGAEKGEQTPINGNGGTPIAINWGLSLFFPLVGSFYKKAVYRPQIDALRPFPPTLDLSMADCAVHAGSARTLTRRANHRARPYQTLLFDGYFLPVYPCKTILQFDDFANDDQCGCFDAVLCDYRWQG